MHQRVDDRALQGTPLEAAVHADHLIVYRIGTESVELVHNLNGAQDYETLRFPSV